MAGHHDAFNGVSASEDLAAFAFHVLEEHFGGGKPSAGALPPDAHVHGLFCTFERLNGDLRGCIGTFEKSPLMDCLKRFSLTSALHDKRFEPIAPAELPQLKCSVTVLSEMKAVQRWDDWEIGRHGVYMTYHDGLRNYNATFLPSVIVDQGWSKHQTFEHLLRKAGAPVRPTREIFEACKVMAYEGSKAGVTHADYTKRFRDFFREGR